MLQCDKKLLLLLNEQNNKHTPIYKYFHIEKTLYKRKLELEATNLTSEAIQKQIHNKFKTAAGLTNTHYKLRAAFRFYDLFNTCKNVLQNPILQPMKVQYIGKLTELEFQQFSDQITSIILDHYLNITDSAWTSTELSLEKKIILPRPKTSDNSDKEKQPALALRKHSNMQTPIFLNVISNTPLINWIMAYQDITKLEKFFGKENNAYSWIADAKKAIIANGWDDDHTIQTLQFFLTRTTDSWYQSLAKKPTSFTEFKLIFLQYFCDPNTLIRLQNQFKAVAFARNFESTEQEVNYTQAPEPQKLTNYYNEEKITTTADTYSNKTVSNSNNLGDPIPITVTTTRNLNTLPKPIPATKILAKHGIPIFHTSKSTVPRNFNNNQVQTNNRLSQPISRASYFGLIKDQGFDKSTSVERRNVEQISQSSKPTKSNISPATITEDTTLAAIFPFDIDNLNIYSLFSKAAINQDKPITALYTDAKVREIDIKLILDSRSAIDHAATARIITADGNTKTPIRKIDNFLFEINEIQIPTKVLHARIPAMCGYFKTQHTEEPLIEFEDISLPLIIKIY
ncbi:hypothetical protein G9A89_008213 [Geosiphon pyriformis]|nr:hypothetical protein G9A89_008213 [Geosiphon pyriformis]